MCVEQLESERSFDRQVFFFFPALPAVLRVMTGGDRLSAYLCVSPEGLRIIAKLVFPFTSSLYAASVLQRGANHPL